MWSAILSEQRRQQCLSRDVQVLSYVSVTPTNAKIHLKFAWNAPVPPAVIAPFRCQELRSAVLSSPESMRMKYVHPTGQNSRKFC